mmetsp:Transcript_43270/g.113995  ORF Transcript_43270/g.113995 Transcript_43270/m.113995 type:complete len:96 (-) Transcript_43270:249-536(-)
MKVFHLHHESSSCFLYLRLLKQSSLINDVFSNVHISDQRYSLRFSSQPLRYNEEWQDSSALCCEVIIAWTFASMESCAAVALAESADIEAFEARQ